MKAIDAGQVRFAATYEPEFRQDPGADPSLFVPGYDAQFQTLQVSNSGRRITMPYSRRTVKIEPGTFQGSWGWQFTLSDTNWLDAILGDPTDGTWNGQPKPMRFYTGYVPVNVDEVIEGAVAQSATVSPQVGNPQTTVTVEGFYSDRYSVDTTPLDSQPTVTNDILRYQDAQLNVNATERLIVQDAQLSLQWPNLEPIEGLGGRTPIGYEVNNFEPDISYTAAAVDPRESELLYGGTTDSMGDDPNDDSNDLNVSFSRDTRSLDFNGTGAFVQSYSEDTLGDNQSRIDESLQFDLHDIEVVES